MTGPLFEIKGLTISFGGLTALQDVDLKVDPGEIVGVIGPNGAGKTTVFNCISRFYDSDRGSIHFKGRDITRCRSHEIIKLGVARTFQNVELCRSMTVLENLLVGEHVVMRGGAVRDAFRLPGVHEGEVSATRRADETMELVGLAPYRDRVVSTLAFGLQKLVELGRALVSRPTLLLLDEPAAGADAHEIEALAALIRRVRSELDLSVLVVEHDMSFVMGLCDRLYVLDFGRRIADGTPAEVQRDPVVVDAYLGVALIEVARN